MKKISFVLSVAVAVMAASVVPVSWAQETGTQTTTQSKTGAGALVGGLLGATAGGVIGHQRGKTTEGVLIGGALGALGGAAVGSQMKTQVPAKTASSTVSAESNSSTTVIGGVDAAKVTMKQIIYWTEQGIPSDEIMSRIEKSKTTFVLTADDVAYLQKKGVSQMVIEAMQGK